MLRCSEPTRRPRRTRSCCGGHADEPGEPESFVEGRHVRVAHDVDHVRRRAGPASGEPVPFRCLCLGIRAGPQHPPRRRRARTTSEPPRSLQLLREVSAFPRSPRRAQRRRGRRGRARRPDTRPAATRWCGAEGAGLAHPGRGGEDREEVAPAGQLERRLVLPLVHAGAGGGAAPGGGSRADVARQVAGHLAVAQTDSARPFPDRAGLGPVPATSECTQRS